MADPVTEPQEPSTPTPSKRTSVQVVSEQEHKQAITDAVTADRQRQASIRAVGRKHGFQDEAERACESETTLSEFHATVLSEMGSRSPGTTTDELGLSSKEKERYSIQNVMLGIVNNDASRMEHELSVSNAIKKRNGRTNSETMRIAIPTDMLMRGWIPRDAGLRSMMYGERALVGVGVGNSEAADLVETALRDDMFIESLREEAVVLGMGVNVMGGLVGDVDIPRELTNPLMYWVAEDVEPTEGDYTLDNLQLRIKTVAGRIPFTRQARQQSTPGIEGLLTKSIRRGLAITIDQALINGSGASGQPRGILNTSGIGSVATTAGVMNRGDLLELEEALGSANADTSRAAGLTNAHGKRLLLDTKTDPASGLFIGRRVSSDENAVDTDIGRFRVSNNVPNNLGGGTDKTAMIYGNFPSLLVGMWGGVELVRDTSTKIATGGVYLRVFQDLDCVVSRAAEFAAIVDLT